MRCDDPTRGDAIKCGQGAFWCFCLRFEEAWGSSGRRTVEWWFVRAAKPKLV